MYVKVITGYLKRKSEKSSETNCVEIEADNDKNFEMRSEESGKCRIKFDERNFRKQKFVGTQYLYINMVPLLYYEYVGK